MIAIDDIVDLKKLVIKKEENDWIIKEWQLKYIGVLGKRSVEKWFIILIDCLIPVHLYYYLLEQ